MIRYSQWIRIPRQKATSPLLAIDTFSPWNWAELATSSNSGQNLGPVLTHCATVLRMSGSTNSESTTFVGEEKKTGLKRWVRNRMSQAVHAVDRRAWTIPLYRWNSTNDWADGHSWISCCCRYISTIHPQIQNDSTSFRPQFRPPNDPTFWRFNITGNGTNSLYAFSGIRHSSPHSIRQGHKLW